MSEWDISKIRQDFPALDQKIHGHQLVYLDNAATTLKCRPVLERLQSYYEKETANVHRGVHYLSEQGTLHYDGTRTAAQRFLNAKHEHEIIFTKGTTEAMNLIAATYVPSFLKAGDEILLSTMEHHSNIVPWQMAAEKIGAKIVEVPVLDNGELDLEAYHKLLTPKVKLVSLTHVSNTLGTINPLKEMIKAAHEIGAVFVVDAAQSAPHFKLDVQDLNCDFLAFSAHKIYGPTGVGILYGKEALLEKMPPFQGGGAMIDQVSFEKTTYNQLPYKFEPGTPAIAEVIATKSAIEYLEKLGLDNIASYEHQLLEYATKKLSEIQGLKIIGQAKEKSSVISFALEGAHPHDLGTLLDRQGIAIRTGHHCTQPLMRRFNVPATARASFSFYNTFEEIDQLVLGIKKAQELL